MMTFVRAPRLARVWTSARQYRAASASTSPVTGTDRVDRVPSGMSYITRSRSPWNALSESTPSPREWERTFHCSENALRIASGVASWSAPPVREWRASVGVVRRFHEALKQILLEAVADGVGVDGIRGFQSWFFGGRWLCLRRAARGHEVNPSPTVPRSDYQIFSCYECYQMIRFE